MHREVNPMSIPKLTEFQVESGLKNLLGWQRRGGSITQEFHFESFPEGIAFVDRVAVIAESVQHHPDIEIHYTRVRFTLTTHDSGGLTQADLDVAAAISAATSELQTA
jgi:4a-hydroxytetrahydrobiopterin dehydratase